MIVYSPARHDGRHPQRSASKKCSEPLPPNSFAAAAAAAAHAAPMMRERLLAHFRGAEAAKASLTELAASHRRWKRRRRCWPRRSRRRSSGRKSAGASSPAAAADRSADLMQTAVAWTVSDSGGQGVCARASAPPRSIDILGARRNGGVKSSSYTRYTWHACPLYYKQASFDEKKQGF